MDEGRKDPVTPFVVKGRLPEGASLRKKCPCKKQEGGNPA